MPTKLAEFPTCGLKLSVKEMSPTKVQRLYAEHIHGILFRLIGEVFAALPRAQTAVASGYSQRRDPATGQLQDEYLLSVRAPRSEWEMNDFTHLAAIRSSSGTTGQRFRLWSRCASRSLGHTRADALLHGFRARNESPCSALLSGFGGRSLAAVRAQRSECCIASKAASLCPHSVVDSRCALASRRTFRKLAGR